MDKVERKRLGGLMDEVEHEGLGELADEVERKILSGLVDAVNGQRSQDEQLDKQNIAPFISGLELCSNLVKSV